MTSFVIPPIGVVHGPIRARRRRGIAASRDSTTTGRRPISEGAEFHRQQVDVSMEFGRCHTSRDFSVKSKWDA
jgi:urease beta subunit